MPAQMAADQASIRPAMPPEHPLAMPTQALRHYDAATRRIWQNPAHRRLPLLARFWVFGGALLLTLYGIEEMYRVINVGGITVLKWVLLFLFSANFSWIALAFTSAVAGFCWLWRASKAPGLPERLTRRTAVAMPIYNEATARVFGALQAMIEDVEATGLGRSFEWFFLSDTTDPDVWVAEERAFLALRARLGPTVEVFYRHRAKNTSRKAGNIADFVSRWGGSYDHMLVLDADSLMTAHAMLNLAAAMEADPDAGIIQTLPLIINRNTLFARLQQFAARIYGPVIASGLSLWMGRDGNYWGHNAIIRTAAFAAHCGLPDLKGKPPFGGHILSHDFVEAAMIRRAGYAVYMLPTLGGSFEESPPSLIDVGTRDRRWCQGNLQHIRVMFASGFHLASRQHFATGIMGYVASPLWMMQLLVGIVLVLQAAYIRPEYFTSQFTLFPAWPRFDAQRALNLFGVTMAVLLAPKGFGLLLALFDGPVRRASGGGIRLVLSALIEVVMSALFAPIMMLIQSGSVMQIVFGRDTGWNPQRRDDGSIPFRDIVRRHRSHVALGVVSLAAGLAIAPSLAAWMSPTIAGLILAIVLSWASGQLFIGLGLRRLGLLRTPEESTVPPIAARANALARELDASGFDGADGLVALHGDETLRDAHAAFLPTAQPRPRGQIEVDHALAAVKLGEARTADEAAEWLKRKERGAVMADRALLDVFARLPAAEADAARQKAA
ncbi:glucans biosynthesis glucosyltransferase MdoH [Lichenihabitans sp. Uapishka_5]|uniref:glucans biosynthesis glucosyltransferase MdoH n=1 Tax=Lichenihabitans sp. Uapishka_5 TaxID=3037302 RepID=UPI0029E7DBD5|nr:glucans biosynthesis glucosyltransferase MdoH [Lichenihabitans sp. Uapishka_5]MDX7953443.1 glucans biosynthesis glucosyltransferase MdoH [Lichenihabitans sp. Uapishka_5]